MGLQSQLSGGVAAPYKSRDSLGGENGKTGLTPLPPFFWDKISVLRYLLFLSAYLKSPSMPSMMTLLVLHEPRTRYIGNLLLATTPASAVKYVNFFSSERG